MFAPCRARSNSSPIGWWCWNKVALAAPVILWPLPVVTSPRFAELADFQPSGHLPADLDAYIHKLAEARRKMAATAALLKGTQAR